MRWESRKAIGTTQVRGKRTRNEEMAGKVNREDRFRTVMLKYARQRAKHSMFYSPRANLTMSP